MINPLAHASSPGLPTPLPDFFAAQSLSRMDAFSAWGMMARFSRVSNNGGPFCLIFADGISAEEIVFKQLRGCQIDTERVDCIENLLLVLVRIQINASYIRPAARPGTRRIYEGYLRLYINPGLGHIPLNRLTAKDM